MKIISDGKSLIINRGKAIECLHNKKQMIDIHEIDYFIDKRKNILLYHVDKLFLSFSNLILVFIRRIIPHKYAYIGEAINKRKETFANVIGLLFFNAIGGLMIVLTNIKVANVLGATLFGIYSYYLAIGEVGASVVRYGRHKTMLRDLIHKSDCKRQLITNTIWLSLINLLFFLITTLILHKPLNIEISIEAVVLVIAPCFVSLDFQPVYESQRLISWHSIYHFIQKLSFLIIIWILVFCLMPLTILNVAIALFLSWFIVIILQYREILSSYRINLIHEFNIKEIRKLYKVGFIVALCCMVGIAFESAIRIIIDRTIDSKSVGIYAAGTQLMIIARFILQQIGRVGNPQITVVCKAGGDYVKKVRFIKLYSLIMLLCILPFAIPMVVCPKILVGLVFSEEYADLAKALPVYGCYLFFCSLGIVFNQYLISVRADRKYFTIYTSSALLSIIIALLFIPKYGFMGGVWAYCISDGFASITYMIVSILHIKKEKYEIQYLANKRD